MPIIFWNEPAGGSAGLTIHVIFRDGDRHPLVPSAASFRLDDIESGDEIVGWQPLDLIGDVALHRMARRDRDRGQQEHDEAADDGEGKARPH